MRRLNLSHASVDALVDRFARVAKDRGAAVLDLNSRRANVFYDHMKAIDDELRSRGREARLRLVPLLHDPDRLVRFYAAEKLLGLVPKEARAVMEWNTKYYRDSITADARGFLRALDDGTYRPD
jgi:hypothetical protein